MDTSIPKTPPRASETGSLPNPASERAAEPPLAIGVPLTQIVPRRLVESPDLVLYGAARSIAAERIRRLKTLLEHRDGGTPSVVVVTSATPREGKSIVAVNLALAYASDPRTETLLLDADLRRPTVEKWLHPPPPFGLAEVLARKAGLEHALLSLKNSPLHVLPAGRPPADPVDLLSSGACRDLLVLLRQRFRRIVIDTPPIVPFTDADVMGRYADGVLFVARHAQTPRSLFAQALKMVTATKVIGIVLNDVVANLADRDQDYGRYYHHYYSRRREK